MASEQKTRQTYYAASSDTDYCCSQSLLTQSLNQDDRGAGQHAHNHYIYKAIRTAYQELWGVANPATHVLCTMSAKRQGERRRCLRASVSRNLRAALRAGGIPSEDGPRKGPAGRPRENEGMGSRFEHPKDIDITKGCANTGSSTQKSTFE
jgi:hypothetical protein